MTTEQATKSTKAKGNIGEDLACIFLVNQGLKIIKRNFKSVHGEVDIICEHNQCLVFVEVKSWTYYQKSNLEFSINHKKRMRIIMTSLYFLEVNSEYAHWNIRYDVIFLAGMLSKIEYIKNAFEGDGTP
jgi:putative endonuclease